MDERDGEGKREGIELLTQNFPSRAEHTP